MSTTEDVVFAYVSFTETICFRRLNGMYDGGYVFWCHHRSVGMGNVTFLGVEGSGKTVLTMALVNLFKAHQAEGWFLRPETRNAFRFIAQVPSELTEETLPHQTTLLKYLAWSVTKDSQVVRQMDMLDYPGEIYRLAFLDAQDDLNPEEFRERVAANQEEINGLLGHLLNSDHVFVLFNLSDAQDIAHNERNLDAVWVTNACLDYLHQLPHKPKVSLLLTQVDRYVDLTKYDFDPKVYVANNLPLIANNFPNLDVCAVSALGAVDAAYGLDSILVRCFESVSLVSSLQDVIQDYRFAYENVFGANIDNSEYFVRIENVLKKLSVRSPEWEQVLPWFIPAESLAHPNGLMDDTTFDECMTVISQIKGRFRLPGSQALWRSRAVFLRQMKPKSEEAQALVNSVLASVKKKIDKEAALKTKADKEAAAKMNGNGCTGVIFFCVMILFVPIIIAIANS